MTLLFVALPVALLIAAAAVGAFIWAARNDQYEDLVTPPQRMLLEDAPVKETATGAAAQPEDGKRTRETAGQAPGSHRRDRRDGT